MDKIKQLDQTLDALLVHPDKQHELLDALFQAWDALSDDEKKSAFKNGLEQKLYNASEINTLYINKL